MQDDTTSASSGTTVTSERDFKTFLSTHHCGEAIREAVKSGDVVEVSLTELEQSERPVRKPGPR